MAKIKRHESLQENSQASSGGSNLMHKQIPSIPNYEKWLKCDDWTLREAIFLSCGIEPNEGLRLLRVSDEIKFRVSEITDLVLRAIRADSLKVIGMILYTNVKLDYHRVRPLIFLKWAIQKQAKLPLELISGFKLLEEETQIREPESLNKLQKPKIHSNAIRYSSEREAVFSAICSVLLHHYKECLTSEGKPVAAKISKIIDLNASKFWPDSKEPPLSAAKIEDLISEAMNKIKKISFSLPAKK